MRHAPIRSLLIAFFALAATLPAARTFAQPSSVEHTPSSQTFGEPANVTQREPDVPREDEAVDLFFRVSFQFTYDRVCIYYTTDGTNPSGSFGSPGGTTQVLRNDLGSISFLRNENNGGVRDWWRATLPASARAYGRTIKYKLSAWQQFNGPEVFANGGTSYLYNNKLAWPGAGAGQPNPGAGYPPVSFWKEEGVIGNTYCAAMLDQNGTYYDFHFPTPGGIQGVGTRNEGYVDGLDTFPPNLPQGWRGQMHLNQAMVGLRVDGLTHWLSNPNAVSYTQVQQSYITDTNTLISAQRLTYGGNNISVVQVDFAPVGVTFPNDSSGNPVRHIAVKRLSLLNNGVTAKTVNVYFYMDPALNGGDGYDAMFFDSAHGAMCAFDKTRRTARGTGVNFQPPEEYNPTTFDGYDKNVALYLAAGMKVGDAGGDSVTESWRDTSGDNSQGWIGAQITIAPNQLRNVFFCLVGGHERPIPTTDNIYNSQLAPALDWFRNSAMQTIENTTNQYWSNWVNDGTFIETYEHDLNTLFKRSLLATALHLDAVNGGVIAGFHNGAYPYVWPRDAVYAAITLARTGHTAEAGKVYDWMRETTYRDFEPWGRKGFWKQKYSTDGYVIWGAPQIDETAVFPWGVKYQFDCTNDINVLANNLEQVRDSVQSMTRDSSDSRLRYEEAFNLVYSNNVWEDSYDTFIYSNANCVRGLRDASAIYTRLGLSSEASDAAGKANTIKSGLDARLDWNGENTDISQLGISYPFNVYSPTDARAARIADRINGVAADTFGNNHPLMNFSGELENTVNRYWGDTYWNGGPWFLSTLWYGLYYAQRADYTPGDDDIQNHYLRINRCRDNLGPLGLGAEQIAYTTGAGASNLYPDFRLQAAWPNAWESMSTIADSFMAFLGFTPDAPNNRMALKPKSVWNTLTFHNITQRNPSNNLNHKIDLKLDAAPARTTATFTNNTGFALAVTLTLRTAPNACILPQNVTRNGVPIATFTYDPAIGALTLDIPGGIETGTNALTIIDVWYPSTDFDHDGFVTGVDYDLFVAAFESGDPASDFDADGFITGVDFDLFVATFEAGC